MTSLFLAIFGYLLSALVFVLDRYILKERIPKPAVYAYFVGLFSIFALGAIPFGFGFFGWEVTALAVFSGMLFVYGLVALYSAIRMSEITRVAPLVGSMTPAVILIFTWCGCILGREVLGATELWAIVLLILGGLSLSVRLPFQSRIFFRGFRYSIPAAIFFAVFFMGFKISSGSQNFVSVFVWSRIGMVCGALSLLLYGPLRRDILPMFRREEREKKKQQWTTVIIFVVNKGLGGVGYLCLSLAVTLGSVTIVQALASIQYAFVIVLGAVATVLFPEIFRVRIGRYFGFQVGIALLLIAAGTILAVLGGEKIFI